MPSLTPAACQPHPWISRDPLRYSTETNHFRYTTQSPTLLIDASGLSPCRGAGACYGEYCSTTGPYGFSEGTNYFCAYVVDNGSCLGSKVRYYLRSNSSTYFHVGKGKGIFKECGDPAQEEIFSLFNRGQDFELVSYFDVNSVGPKGILQNCRVLEKTYSLDVNRCYDLVFEWECDLQCGMNSECNIPKSDYVLGAWDRDPITGSISKREGIATFLLGFESDLKTSGGSCSCPIGSCDINVGLHWAQNAMTWYEPGTTKVAGSKMLQDCSWSNLPTQSHSQVGPGNPGNARLPKE